jgi:hypothetical protein
MPPGVSERGVSVCDWAAMRIPALFGVGVPLPADSHFFASETGALLSSTAQYYRVAERMPARYRVLYIDGDAIPAEFTGLWSLMPCGAAESRAARRLLQFMLTREPQDILHIRGRSGALPLNREAMDIFIDIYGDFSDFFVNMEYYAFD